MKKVKPLHTLFVFAFLILSAATSHSQQVYKAEETLSILQAVSNKLNNIQSISYKYSRESLYAGENYHNTYNTAVYFDFTNNGAFHFQAEDEKHFSCYNGSQYFFLNKVKKDIDIKQKPGRDIFESLSPLYNSVVSLKAILPMLIKNDSIQKVLKDTVIDEKQFYHLSFELYNHYLGNLGDINNFTAAYTGDKRKPYEIIIHKKTLLPHSYTAKFRDRKDDFIAARFTDININPKKPAGLSWFYSTYTAEYKSPGPQKQLVSLSTELKNWTLPSYSPEKTDSVSLYPYRGKVVLLDFWIKTCGPCLASFPHLNELQQKFGSDKFQLLSINTEDSKEDIAFFYKKHRPVYKMLFEGGKLAEAYGVSYFPTCIMLDKAGRVIYAGGFDKDEIEKLLVKLL
ncbi:MAG: TlpA family protein disulfide reductase [Ferruginibacter sp.]|nr:TlpA family protein disulfide reductase [Ferruginibacter sp.]